MEIPVESPRAAQAPDREADEGPSPPRKKGWRSALHGTKEALKEHNLSIVAAGVAFYVFLGLFPALAALISIYGLVADPATIRQQVDALGGLLPQDVIKIVDAQMTRIADQSTGATLAAIVGIAVALWSGAKAIKAVMMALNITYDEHETRGFFRLNGTALALTLAGTLGVIAAVSIIVLLPPVLRWVGIDDAAVVIVSILRWPLLALLALAGFSLLYRYGPDHDRTRWRWVSWGAVLATGLWLVVSAGFAFFVSKFGNYNATYGSLGAVVVLLMWFLLTAYVVLLGSEINAQFEGQTAPDKDSAARASSHR